MSKGTMIILVVIACILLAAANVALVGDARCIQCRPFR